MRLGGSGRGPNYRYTSIEENEDVQRNDSFISFDGDYIVLSGKGICISLLIICIIVLLLLCMLWSLHFVPYDEYALERNRLGTVYQRPVLSQGVYLLSPIIGLVYFPSTMQKVHMNSVVFSDSGVAFNIEIQFFYHLPAKHVYDIYNKFSYSYDSRIQSNSKKTVKNIAGGFAVSDFLGNRTFIESVLAQGVYTDLLHQVHVVADPQYFKIINITFPDNIIENSLKSAIALQTNEIQYNQQKVNVVFADTKQIVSTIQAEAEQLVQNSLSKSKALMMTANYEYEKIAMSARSEGIKHVIQLLEISNENVNELIDVLALIDNNANKTVFRNMSRSNVIVDLF